MAADLSAPLTERFKRFWNEMRRENVGRVSDLYAPDIVFEDPAHRVVGLGAMRDYLANLYSQVQECRFSFEDEMAGPDAATLTWTMQLRHPRLRGGQLIEVRGASFLRFNQYIHLHRDYFDLGAMLYEHVPVVGSLVRQVKRRL